MLLTSSSQVDSLRGKIASNPLGVRAFGLTHQESSLSSAPLSNPSFTHSLTALLTDSHIWSYLNLSDSKVNPQIKDKKTQGWAWTPRSTNWFCCVILTFKWWQLWCDYCVIHNHKECWVGNTSKLTMPLLKRRHPPNRKLVEFVPTQSEEVKLRCNRHSGAHLSSIQVTAAGIL